MRGGERRDREPKTDRLACLLDRLNYAIMNTQSMGPRSTELGGGTHSSVFAAVVIDKLVMTVL